jgi:hypothetical protein
MAEIIIAALVVGLIVFDEEEDPKPINVDPPIQQVIKTVCVPYHPSNTGSSYCFRAGMRPSDISFTKGAIQSGGTSGGLGPNQIANGVYKRSNDASSLDYLISNNDGYNRFVWEPSKGLLWAFFDVSYKNQSTYVQSPLVSDKNYVTIDLDQ